MQEILLNWVQLILNSIPTIVAAFLVLFVGWLIALVVSAVVRRLLHRTEVDNRIAASVAGETAAGVEVERWISRGVFWLIMIFVLVAFFQVLGLTIITQPLNQLLVQIFNYAPRLLGAALLLLVAWLVASALRYITQRALTLARVEERFDRLAGAEEEAQRMPLAKTLGDVVYWLVFLLFLPAILGALAVEGLLDPVQGMIDNILGYLPNLFAAGLIVLVGWLAARIAQRIVTNLLAAVGADRLSERIELDRVLGEQRLSDIVGFVVYVLILIPVLIAALNALALEAITQPASNMLNLILAALPNIFAAGLLLAIAYIVGRLVASLVTNVLTGIGFNGILWRLGLRREIPTGARTPSEIVGYLTLVAVMLLASIEAAQLLGFQTLGTLISALTVFLGRIVLGVIIFGIGLYLADLAADVIKASGATQANLLAVAARLSILTLAGAIALSQMGLASDIIRLAFGLLLAALALAAALAFGLGGREVAGEQLREWLGEVQSEQF